jgi:hypothetical protein
MENKVIVFGEDFQELCEKEKKKAKNVLIVLIKALKDQYSWDKEDYKDTIFKVSKSYVCGLKYKEELNEYVDLKNNKKLEDVIESNPISVFNFVEPNKKEIKKWVKNCNLVKTEDYFNEDYEENNDECYSCNCMCNKEEDFDEEEFIKELFEEIDKKEKASNKQKQETNKKEEKKEKTLCDIINDGIELGKFFVNNISKDLCEELEKSKVKKEQSTDKKEENVSTEKEKTSFDILNESIELGKGFVNNISTDFSDNIPLFKGLGGCLVFSDKDSEEEIKKGFEFLKENASKIFGNVEGFEKRGKEIIDDLEKQFKEKMASKKEKEQSNKKVDEKEEIKKEDTSSTYQYVDNVESFLNTNYTNKKKEENVSTEKEQTNESVKKDKYDYIDEMFKDYKFPKILNPINKEEIKKEFEKIEKNIKSVLEDKEIKTFLDPYLKEGYEIKNIFTTSNSNAVMDFINKTTKRFNESFDSSKEDINKEKKEENVSTEKEQTVRDVDNEEADKMLKDIEDCFVKKENNDDTFVECNDCGKVYNRINYNTCPSCGGYLTVE